ncbi:hypothetical protein NE237_001073 [Protea cynaroides]|uniref:Uncharacterized protein n=1 Tax=Protea cynaroides TaxID=273540 RepID=A0A9Q0KSE3_9MAGN|nr:hypothetical protein NE237_001073 [Protea cynaroides]
MGLNVESSRYQRESSISYKRVFKEEFQRKGFDFSKSGGNRQETSFLFLKRKTMGDVLRRERNREMGMEKRVSIFGSSSLTFGTRRNNRIYRRLNMINLEKMEIKRWIPVRKDSVFLERSGRREWLRV